MEHLLSGFNFRITFYKLLSAVKYSECNYYFWRHSSAQLTLIASPEKGLQDTIFYRLVVKLTTILRNSVRALVSQE